MDVFVFPLAHVVFYPSISKPFHVFEPRYVQMVRDAIAQNKSIAIGYVDDPTQQYQFFPGQKLDFVRDIVGFGAPLIMEEKPEGGLIVFLQGVGKLRLGPVLDVPVPYIVCQADLIAENLTLLQSSVGDIQTIQKMVLSWVNEHVSEKRNRDQFLQLLQSPNEIIGCFVSYLLSDRDIQQLILEEDDINQKIKIIMSLILSGKADLLPS